jgi:hypothetical protein
MLINRCSDGEYNNGEFWMPLERMTDIKKAKTEDGMELLYEERYGKSPPPEFGSPALEFGTSVHNAVLLGESDFGLQEHDGRTKEGKAAKAKAAEEGIRLVNKAEYERLTSFITKAIAMFMQEYGSTPNLDNSWLTEVAVSGEYSGMGLKAKLDAYRDETIIDLKSIGQWPDGGRFLGHIDKYGYAESACGYINVARQAGLEVREYRWLFVESKWPFRARWVVAPDWMLEDTWPVLEKCYQNMMRLESFVPPTHVELQNETWWQYRYGTEVSLEGVEEYAE